MSQENNNLEDQLKKAKKISDHYMHDIVTEEGETRFTKDSFYTGTAVYSVGSAIPGISGGGVFALTAAKPVLGSLAENVQVGENSERLKTDISLIDDIDMSYYKSNSRLGAVCSVGLGTFAATQAKAVLVGIGSAAAWAVGHPIVIAAAPALMAARYSGLELKDIGKLLTSQEGLNEVAQKFCDKFTVERFGEDVSKDWQYLKDAPVRWKDYADKSCSWLRDSTQADKEKAFSDCFDRFKEMFQDDDVSKGDSNIANRSAAMAAAFAIDVGSNYGLATGGAAGWAMSIPISGVAGGLAGGVIGSVYSRVLYPKKEEIFLNRKARFTEMLNDEYNNSFKTIFLDVVNKEENKNKTILGLYDDFCNRLASHDIEETEFPSLKQFDRWIDLISRDTKKYVKPSLTYEQSDDSIPNNITEYAGMIVKNVYRKLGQYWGSERSEVELSDSDITESQKEQLAKKHEHFKLEKDKALDVFVESVWDRDKETPPDFQSLHKQLVEHLKQKNPIYDTEQDKIIRLFVKDVESKAQDSQHPTVVPIEAYKKSYIRITLGDGTSLSDLDAPSSSLSLSKTPSFSSEPSEPSR